MGDAKAVVTLILTRTSGVVLNLGAALETASAFIETKRLDGGEDAFVKYLDRVLYNIRDLAGNDNMRLEIWGADTEDGAMELLDTLYPATEDPGYTDPPGQRFYKLKFIDEAVSQRWSIHGFSLYGELGGEEF